MRDAIAIAWLRKEDWAEWQSIEPLLSYDRWLSKMEAMISTLAANGLNPTKIDVDPKEFVAWCRLRGLTVGSPARGQYAAEILMQRVETVKNDAA
jgi:hypothetical protein